MPKNVPSWVKSGIKTEYTKLANRVRAKKRNIKKKYGIDFDSVIQTPGLHSFESKKDYNQWKKQVEKFTNRYNLAYQFRKNDEGIVASVKEINLAKRMNKLARDKAIKKDREIKKLPYFANPNEKSGTVGDRMVQYYRPQSVTGIYIPDKFDFNKFETRRDFKEYIETMSERAKPDYFTSRNEIMKQNFIETLEFSYNSLAEDLIKSLRNINADDFYEMYIMFDAFDFDLYQSESAESSGGMKVEALSNNENLQKMYEYVKMYEDGKVDMDLKGF